jgi:MtN3 and saliva related transmembrane protein
MAATDYLGYLAALCSTSAYAPQVWKAWRTRRTKDISFKAFAVLVTGQTLWLLYGFLRSDWPIVASNLVTISFTSTILYLKSREKTEGPERGDSAGANLPGQ